MQQDIAQTPTRLQGAGSDRPTPYLRALFARRRFPRRVLQCLDLGAGNGRNTLYLRELGHFVMAYDAHPSGAGIERWEAGQRLPVGPRTVDLVLCQYLFMFLPWPKIGLVMNEVRRVTKTGGLLVVELQSDVKTAVHKDLTMRELLGAEIDLNDWARLDRQKYKATLVRR